MQAAFAAQTTVRCFHQEWYCSETACVAEVGNPLLTDNLTFIRSERALIVYYLTNALELTKEKHSRII